MKTVAITGNTYPVKDQLKALGGRWDGGRKAWMVPEEKEEEAKKLVAAAPVDTFRSPNRRSGMRGQLWQECYCGTEPVCVNCERCERHCRC